MNFRIAVTHVCCLIVVNAGTVSGQGGSGWEPRTDLNEQLPASIRVYELDRGEQFLWAWYALADPSDTSWVFHPVLTDGDPRTVTQFSEQHDALLAVNGGYFGGGDSYSFVGSDGQTLADNLRAVTRDGATFYPTRGAFGLMQNGFFDVSWIYRVGGGQYAYPNPSPNRPGAPQPQPTAGFPEGGAIWPFHAGIGGGPVLVQDGVPRVTWEEEVFFGGSGVSLDTRQARTAIGHTEDGKIIMMVVDGGVALPALAEMMIEVGAVEALNLDGGGSSTFVVNSTLINRPGGGSVQRPVASAVLLMPQRDTTDPDQPDFTYFDSGDACCYREEGGWFESANAPWHGTTRSRIVEVGDGSARAAFILQGIEPGTYDLEALWSPANNRATNTPYTVYRDGFGTTVRVDQTAGVNSAEGPWNVIGRFLIAGGDSVVISNDAAGNVSPAYVVVDAIRIAPVVETRLEPAAERTGLPLQLYPNPAASTVFLDWDGDGWDAAEIAVYDLLGRHVSRAEIPPGSGHAVFDVSVLPTGPYLVRVRQGSRHAERLLIVLP